MTIGSENLTSIHFAGTGVTIYLTASNPKKMRFFMIHGLPESCIVISYYYTDPNRIDVYTNDGNTYQIPKNGEMVNGKFSYKQDTTVNYVPTCSDPHGANYIDQTSRLIYFVLKVILLQDLRVLKS